MCYTRSLGAVIGGHGTDTLIIYSFWVAVAQKHWLLHLLLRFRVVLYVGAQFFLAVYLLPAQ